MKIQLRFILILIFINLVVAAVYFQLEALRALKDAEIYREAQQLPLTQFGLANVKFLGFILSVSTIAISIIIYLWLVRPLVIIITAMSSGDLAPLLPMSQKTSEFGKLAKLIYESLEDKRRLEREIRLRDAAEESLQLREEQLKTLYKSRERLLRDLHDDTIQSLFALGLRIESGFEGNQKTLLQQKGEFKQLVNGVITSLRSHLEESPSSPIAGHFDFDRSIRTLSENLEKLGTCKFTIDIDQQLESKLNVQQGHEITTIATEAFSNALRHGVATKITFTASLASQGICEIQIKDNGHGCNLENLNFGKGLRNIQGRVQELGGSIQMKSTRPGGLTLNLSIPLHHNES